VLLATASAALYCQDQVNAAYAVNIASGTVTQIGTATGTALKPVTLKAGLAAIVFTP
jgi:hypothetical protein